MFHITLLQFGIFLFIAFVATMVILALTEKPSRKNDQWKEYNRQEEIKALEERLDKLKGKR